VPNNSFKPKLLRSGNGVAEKACHAVACATQFGLTQALGLMKTGRDCDEWLKEYQGFKKYLNQCVMCQSVGYDPVKIEVKEGLYFKAKVMEYFNPLTVNEIGLCSDCVERFEADRG
jgi:hypothetical protein